MTMTKPTFGPEHEGKEIERLEQDRMRQKVPSLPVIPANCPVLEKYSPVSRLFRVIIATDADFV